MLRIMDIAALGTRKPPAPLATDIKPLKVTPRAQKITVRAVDLIRVRQLTALRQKDFAELLDVTDRSIRNWELGAKPCRLDPVRYGLLQTIARFPSLFASPYR